MATDSWVNETLYADWGQRFLVKRELARVQSDFQDIMIFESTSHGRVMLASHRSPRRMSSSIRKCSPTCRCWRMAMRRTC